MYVVFTAGSAAIINVLWTLMISSLSDLPVWIDS